MKKKFVVLLTCASLVTLFVAAFAQNVSEDEVIIPNTGNLTLDAPMAQSAVPDEHNAPATKPTIPTNVDTSRNCNINLDNLAFFDTERENVEMFAATTDGVQLTSIQGTVVHAKDNEVHIDTDITEFCMMQTGTLPYQTGETVTVWVAVKE